MFLRKTRGFEKSCDVSKKDEPKCLIKDEISVFLIALTRFDIDFE